MNRRIEWWVLLAAGAYGVASLTHFWHNAEFCGDYPNLPAWITRGSVWLSWVGLTLLGGAGLWLLRCGHRKSGLGLLAFYGALGCYGLGHYTLAPIVRHTAMINFSIWFEVIAGLILLVVALGALIGDARHRARSVAPMKALMLLGLLVAAMTCNAHAQTGAPVGGKLLSDEAYGKIVKCALRDRSGNLWFGTNWAGVFRYDGKTFTRFSTQDGLGGDMVNALCEDKEGVLWLGTEKGVFRYDGNTFSAFPLQAVESFTAFLGHLAPAGAAVKIVTSIVQDKAGNMWFGIWGPPGEAGAYRYDGKQVVCFLPRYPTQGIVADDDGGVWLNSKRYDGQTFTDFSEREHAFKEAVFCSLKDREGNLWFGVRDPGLYRYDGKSFTYFPAKDGSFERVTCIFQDSAGRIWLGGDIRFGTDKGGLAYYDGKSFVHFPQIDALGLYGVWAAAEDKSGNLWFGGRGGKLLRYDGKDFTDLSDALKDAP